MKLNIIAVSYALLASAALAAPYGQSSSLETRVARRIGRSTKPLQRIEVFKDGSNETQVDYSSNWSGAVLTSPPSGQKFEEVTATFVVPTPKVPSGSSSSGSYAASAWVGIDGDTYQNAILQTGVDFTISNGRVSFDAWYEWFPDYAYDFSIDISAGDTITATVTSTSNTAGTAVIENVTTGQKVTKALTSSSALGGQNAEWIVEDFEEGSSLVNLADWGTVTFTGASAKTGRVSVTPAGADIIDIQQDGSVLTSVSVSGSTVTDKYI